MLNTPSNHRVHHGIEPKYLDKNFAGMFLVWDRLFGTYQPEEEEPTYGVTRAFESKNPLVANVAYFVEWARGLSRVAAERTRASTPSGSRLVTAYAAAQMTVFCLFTLACFAWARDGDLAPVAAAAITVIVAVSTLGLLLDASERA